MAIWQISFNIVENKTYNSKDIVYWIKEPENADNITFLEKHDSWSSDIIQYGDLQSTCIEISKENGRIVELCVRLDLRTLSKDILNNVVEYIKGLDGYIYYQNEIIEPTFKNVVFMIKESTAYKFCKNPMSFIDELSKIK